MFTQTTLRACVFVLKLYAVFSIFVERCVDETSKHQVRFS